MEKRWCERIPVSISVVLIHQGNKIGQCKTKNISLRGICLNSGPLAFSDNTEITLQFVGQEGLYNNTNDINAIVVRNTPDEISLMFNPIIPEMITPIINYAKNELERNPATRLCFALD